MYPGQAPNAHKRYPIKSLLCLGHPGYGLVCIIDAELSKRPKMDEGYSCSDHVNLFSVIYWKRFRLDVTCVRI